MKTIEIKLYKFSELSKEAKQTAIENWRKSNWESGDFLHFFEEDCNEQISEAGFESPAVSYSLSYSQGDGLSFKADKYNKLSELFLKHLGQGKEKTAELLAENCTQILKGNNGRYCFASKNDIDLYFENYSSSINTDMVNCQKVLDKVLKDLENIYIELCKNLENQGYKQIKFENSDEYIIETIEVNDYDFTEDGEIY